MTTHNFAFNYVQQVDLLLKILPIVANEQSFALKGGTAINLFVRDMPRLSIDIDLVYLPLQQREQALKGIEQSLLNIRHEIQRRLPGISIEEKRTKQDGRLNKLIIGVAERIKIEPNEILRGTLFSIEKRSLSKTVEELFQKSVINVSIVSLADLYAGKLCAALDRQHPRDLFDIFLLYKHEGLTDLIRQAFVIYLACSPRPMHELLNPNLIDQSQTYKYEFQGMTNISIDYDELINTRSRLIQDIQQRLTDNEREFLLSVKYGEPKYNLMPFAHLEQLPAIQWKLINIKKMGKAKRQSMVHKLQMVLEQKGQSADGSSPSAD